LHYGSVPVALATVALALAACGSAPSSSLGTTTTEIGNTGSTTNTGIGNTGTMTLTGSKVELLFTDRVFTSCPSTEQAQTAPTFTYGGTITEEPGATGKPDNVTIAPSSSTAFGNYMDGTFSSKHVMVVTGKSQYDAQTWTLQLAPTGMPHQLAGPVNVTGTAEVVSYFVGHPPCDTQWKVTGTDSPGGK
jgi:hypothetical protein